MAAAKRSSSKRSASKKSSSSRSTRSTRSSRSLGLSVPGFVTNPVGALRDLNILGNVLATVNELRSVAGVKRVLERVGAFGGPTIMAFAQVMERHFNGPQANAHERALALTGATGVLAPVGAAYLEAPGHAYVQFAVGAGAIFGIGSRSDWPAYLTAATLFLSSNCYVAGSAHGATDIFVRMVSMFMYANATLLFITTARARALFSSKQITALRKLAVIVPALGMNAFMMQGASMAKMQAAGMKGPGVLGPVAGLLFHPLNPPLSVFMCLAHLSGLLGKRAALFLTLQYLVVAISLMPQIVYPFGYAMAAAHLLMGMHFMKESFPANSFLPKLK